VSPDGPRLPGLHPRRRPRPTHYAPPPP